MNAGVEFSERSEARLVRHFRTRCSKCGDLMDWAAYADEIEAVRKAIRSGEKVCAVCECERQSLSATMSKMSTEIGLKEIETMWTNKQAWLGLTAKIKSVAARLDLQDAAQKDFVSAGFTMDQAAAMLFVLAESGAATADEVEHKFVELWA